MTGWIRRLRDSLRTSSSLRLLSFHAQAGGCESLNHDFVRRESRGCTHVSPVVRRKGASDGNGAIVLHKRMQTCQLRERLEEMIGNLCARKVVDEPAHARLFLHPPKKMDNVTFDQVMGEQRAHDDIDGSGALVTENIGGHPLDRACLWRGFSSDGYGVRVEIATCQQYADLMLPCPCLNLPQSVSISAADVQDSHGRLESLQIERIKKIED